MPLEEQIVEWSRSRPDWQRAILKQVAEGQAFSPTDYDNILDALLSAKPFYPTFSLEHFPRTTAGDEPVTLLSIEQLEHVNALTPDKPLTFADKGLTIIYGDNGSGKSGYARLLKRIARSRHREQEILSDVFKDNSLAKPTATLAIKIGTRGSTFKWPDSSPREVKRLLFFDDACGAAYVSTESDFPYRPSALFVLEGLVDVCLALRDRIDSKLQANNQESQSLPLIDEQLRETDIGSYLRNLSAFSSLETLDKLSGEHSDLPKTIADLKEGEARVAVADPTTEKHKLTRQIAKLDSLHRHLENLNRLMNKTAIEALQQEQDQLNALLKQSRDAAESFKSEPLSGVGQDVWRQLWNAARIYSEDHAYPFLDFPVTEESSRCVLCQQVLETEARERLKRFHSLVGHDLEGRVSETDFKWTARVQELDRFQIKALVIESNLTDHESDHSELVLKARALLSDYETARSAIIDAVRYSKMIPFSDLDKDRVRESMPPVIMKVESAAAKLTSSENAKAEIVKIVAERKRLELIQAAMEKRPTIELEIARLKRRKRLEDLKQEAATTTITKKIVDLSESSITDVVRDRFTRETDRLSLERVTITKTRGDKGILLHQPRLVGATQEVTLPRVLSEGEQTALGLAAFFTEAELDESRSALIFDDPVSSLDHVRRLKVAERLADFAEARQVIVFTHEAVFVLDLKKQADARGIPRAERTVSKSRAADRKPGVCSLTHPWKTKDVSERLHELRTDIARIKKESAQWDDSRYETEIGTWAGKLSETWERIFSQEVIGQIVEEGGLEFRPKKTKILASFSEQDQTEFQSSYDHVSLWSKRHDKSTQVNYVAPDTKELEEELKRVEEWFKRVKAYKN
jgi:energy-coupling factor transporter ATP-binding protein EcfA2